MLPQDYAQPLFLCPVDLHKLVYALSASSAKHSVAGEGTTGSDSSHGYRTRRTRSQTIVSIDLRSRYEAMREVLRDFLPLAQEEVDWLDRRLGNSLHNPSTSQAKRKRNGPVKSSKRGERKRRK